MWKRIIIYIIILIILLGLYFLFTPQATNGPKGQKAGTDFRGPTSSPSIKGPTSPPPQQ